MEYSYQFEEWRDIPEYFGLYQISNFGRVRSLNYNHTGKKNILKPNKNKKTGYLSVTLWKDGKVKRFLVHRLVAEAFIPNTDNLPQVNHKDEDKTNNCVWNLEFCDAKYNTNYGTGIKRMAEKLSKPVNQYTLDGLLVAQYPSIREVQRQNGYHNGNICECCNGKRKTHKKYKWKWAE